MRHELVEAAWAAVGGLAVDVGFLLVVGALALIGIIFSRLGC